MNSTAEEQEEPKTAARKVYRGDKKTRKLRKMDDGGIQREVSS